MKLRRLLCPKTNRWNRNGCTPIIHNASWKSSPSCASRSSPPSTRGTSSSHPASTNKQNSWTMLSLFSFWYRTVELARLRCSCLYPFVYLKRTASNCLKLGVINKRITTLLNPEKYRTINKHKCKK